MKIREITLFTNKLSDQKDFYKNSLGFEVLEEDKDEFSVQIGYSKLSFKKSMKNYKYHYCFLIPSNKLDESIDWLNKRLNIIKIEGNRITQKFESWNAKSVYFYDGSGNLAEFIVRYDLRNERPEKFDLSQILCVNEIGMPTTNVERLNSELEHRLNSKFWKGDLKRFGTNGTQNGLFLLVNNDVKKNWFPTELETESSPFSAIVDVNMKHHKIEFVDGEFKKVGNAVYRA